MTQTTEKAGIGRRKFLTGAAVATAGAVAMPSVSRAQTTTLRMQSSWPTSDIFHEMAQEYVDRVQKMSGGRLTIDLTPAGAIVGAFQIQDAVQDGVLDGGHHVTVYWYGKDKAASLFGTGPIFGGNAQHMLAWIHKGGGKELYQELMEKLGLDIVGFFAMPMPTQPLGWFAEEVKGAEDLSGLKYRTVGLAADLMQSLGVAVTQLPGGEIVPAMERGVIDAFEYNNPTSDRRFGAQDVAKNYMLGSFHQANEFFEIIFNKSRFDSLAEEERAILEYAAEAASTSNYATAMDNYSRDLQALIGEDGVNVVRTPASVSQAQLEAWDKLLVNLNGDEYFKRVVDSQKAWCDRVVFYDLMNAADYKLAYQHHFPDKITF